MEDMDKTIEVMKAAMEKENVKKVQSGESMEDHIDQTKTDADNAEYPEDVSLEEDGMDPLETQEDTESDFNDETDEEIQETDSEPEVKSSKSGKSFFKSSKNKELAAKDLKIEELTDRVMRTIAEFDNFRKRSEKEKSQMFDLGAKSVIEKLLPVIDNFERGLGTISEKDKENAFIQGIEMIYKQMMTVLEEIGVKSIDAIGKEFDPAFHNAVMHGEDETLGENVVSEEFQKGYMYHDIVVRHSMVKVVN